VSLEAEILPPQTADQTRTTLPWEILLENHQQIDACALVPQNQYPAQSFPRNPGACWADLRLDTLSPSQENV
jgi:hypothetical protein